MVLNRDETEYHFVETLTLCESEPAKGGSSSERRSRLLACPHPRLSERTFVCPEVRVHQDLRLWPRGRPSLQTCWEAPHSQLTGPASPPRSWSSPAFLRLWWENTPNLELRAVPLSGPARPLQPPSCRPPLHNFLTTRALSCCPPPRESLIQLGPCAKKSPEEGAAKERGKVLF